MKTATRAPASEPDPRDVELCVLRAILFAEELPIMQPSDEPIISGFAQSKPTPQTRGAHDQARGTGGDSEIRQSDQGGAGVAGIEAHDQRGVARGGDGFDE